MPRLARALLVLVSMALVLLAFACGDDDDDALPANGAGGTATEAPAATEANGATPAPAGTLSLTSSAFEDNTTMPVQYTCDGDATLSPPLAIAGVPDGAASLALLMIDIDAGDGSGFVHWTAFNIDPSESAIAEGAAPTGAIEGQTSLGDGGYFGPCPPSGEHRYVFTLYALDTTLELDASADVSAIEDAIEGHVLDESQLTGLYTR